MTTANYIDDTPIFDDKIFGPLHIFMCVSIILVILTNAFLMIAIFLDRKSHGKSRSLSLLNYMLNYALFALFIYFVNIFTYLFPGLPASTCVFFRLTYAVLDEGTKYFLFPICCDFIAKYFHPSKDENRKFLILHYTITGILLAFIWIKGLAVILIHSKGVHNCHVYFDNHFHHLEKIFSTFVMIPMLVFVGVLIYIAIKGKQCEMMKSPLRTLIIFLILVTMICLQQILFSFNIFPLFSVKMFVTYQSVYLSVLLLLPFLWFFDATIRQSVRKLLSGKCKESTDHPSHELTQLN